MSSFSYLNLEVVKALNIKINILLQEFLIEIDIRIALASNILRKFLSKKYGIPYQ